MNNWISLIEKLPETSSYYEVKFIDGTTDEKPFRINKGKNIFGFLSEKRITHWREIENNEDFGIDSGGEQITNCNVGKFKKNN